MCSMHCSQLPQSWSLRCLPAAACTLLAIVHTCGSHLVAVPHLTLAHVCCAVLRCALQVGEAPDEIRNVCRQRSRWTKGHMQIFFSRRCPLFNWNLPFIHKLLYTNGTWA